MEMKEMKIDDLTPAYYNPRKDLGPDDAEYIKLKRSIENFGYVDPVIYNQQTGTVVGGHQRLKVLKDLGYESIMVSVIDVTEEQEKALNLALNKIDGEWDNALLKDLLEELNTGDFDMDLTGFDFEEIEDLMTQFHVDEEDDEDEDKNEITKTLKERFIVPPFSVLDARQGYWQERKRAWVAIGIKSELGRGENLLEFSEGMRNGYARTFGQDLMRGEHILGNKEVQEQSENSSGTSIFDPVLCELSYSWFSPEGGTIIDPFAGGSVRGIVAGRLGRKYYGIDLRPEQIEANEEQINDIEELREIPNWFVGDSQDLDTILPAEVKADLIFSCPPYADLEVYSDDPKDLSTMEYHDFLEAYRNIIKKSVSRLKDDSFACFVVGDVRDKKGYYRNFVGDTIQAFEDAGMKYYNEAILVTSIGSLAMRVDRQFSASRKLGKAHQNVLVFFKGDTKKIREKLGEINVEEILREHDEVYGEEL